MKKKISVLALAVFSAGMIAYGANSYTATAQQDKNCKVTICFKGKTLEVACSAFPAFMSKGASWGACN